MISSIRRLGRAARRRGIQLVRKPLQVFPPARLRKLLEIPGTHLFVGYYDIDPFFDGRTILAHAVKSEDAVAQVGLCDVPSGAFRTLAATPCWSWQLGARFQMLDRQRLVFNTMAGEKPVAHIVNGAGDRMGELPFNIFSFDASRRRGATLDFGRLYRHRSGYGYRVLADRKSSGIEAVDKGIGIFDVEHGGFLSAIDVDTAWNEAVRRGLLAETTADAPRYLNHPLFSPSGNEVAFVLVVDGTTARRQSLMVADVATGSILGVMPVRRQASHFWWVRPGVLSAFVSAETGQYRGQYMNWDVAASTVQEMGPAWPRVDGHQTNHPTDDWWITDTYPDRYGFQHLYAQKEDEKSARVYLGRFRSRLGMGANKCDLHPRRSAEGSLVAVDTAYEPCRRIAVIEPGLSNPGG